jgi:6-phosphogluconolactonase (cycloisomerase 2 family)
MMNPETSRRTLLKAAAGATAAVTLNEALGAPKADAADGKLMAYVGTFSAPLTDTLPTQVDLPPGNGRGIHLFEVDRTTGALKEAGTFDLGTSPSCLAVGASGKRLYSANETDKVGPDKMQGSVSAYAINPADGKLTMLNSVPSGGAGPTYISLHPSGRHLFVANYFGGSIAVLPILSGGKLGNATDFRQMEGSVGPTKATHAPPGTFAVSGHDRTHAHQIVTDPTARFVLSVELGQDRIYVWKFDAVVGKLSPAKTPFVSLPPGDGPRHVHFHPNGKWMYSLQEEGSTIVLFDWDAADGTLTPRQTISTLPAGYAGSNFTSEILVSHDGRFVYAGNRLHDSIGIFAIGADGQLRHLDDVWTRGDYPRSFAFTPDGGFLYCLNQRADHVAVFKVNRRSGLLKFTGHFAPVGNPSHLVFLELG